MYKYRVSLSSVGETGSSYVVECYAVWKKARTLSHSVARMDI